MLKGHTWLLLIILIALVVYIYLLDLKYTKEGFASTNSSRGKNNTPSPVPAPGPPESVKAPGPPESAISKSKDIAATKSATIAAKIEDAPVMTQKVQKQSPSPTVPAKAKATPAPLKQTFTTNLENMSSILVPTAEEVTIDFMDNMVNVLERGNRIPDNWQGSTICIDTVDLERVKKGNLGKSKKIEKPGYFIRLVNRERMNELKSPLEIVNRKIGVFDICESHLVQAIAYGYRITNIKPIINISYISKNKRTELKRLLDTTYDVIFAYIIPGSKFESLIYSQEVGLLGFDKLDITRVHVTFPYITPKKSYMTDVYDWKKNLPKAVYVKEGTMNLLWSQQHMFEIGEPKNALPINPNRETFITNLTVSPEMSDPTYSCYGEPTNENRALCNSSYDAWGNLKEEKTLWDVRCLEHTDCPFYKANKNYPNDFGRCKPDGICEMPTGIRRISFVKYRDDFPYMPMCYGCDPEIMDCCKDQKENPKKYPKLISPDYAFPYDIVQRSPRGLQTVIPLP